MKYLFQYKTHNQLKRDIDVCIKNVSYLLLTLEHCLTPCSKLPQTKQGFFRLTADLQFTAICPSSPQL